MCGKKVANQEQVIMETEFFSIKWGKERMFSGGCSFTYSIEI